LFRKPLTMEEYLNARPIAAPLRLFDCVMPCAGAEALLVMERQRAEDLGLKYARILGTIERHNAFPDDPIQTRGGWALDRNELFSMAGVNRDDVDFVQAYDDYPVINVLQLEDLGFCDKGAGPDFVRSHTFTASGTFPFNTRNPVLETGR
jgi:acetyl-CoA acetyltransferase